jgi:hypothetical protein
VLVPSDALRTLVLVRISAPSTPSIVNSRSILRVAVAAEERRARRDENTPVNVVESTKKLDVKIL